MTDRPETDQPETPMQRALRLKKEAHASKGGPPAGARRGEAERAAAARSSARSKPWLKR